MQMNMMYSLTQLSDSTSSLLISLPSGKSFLRLRQQETKSSLMVLMQISRHLRDKSIHVAAAAIHHPQNVHLERCHVQRLPRSLALHHLLRTLCVEMTATAALLSNTRSFCSFTRVHTMNSMCAKPHAFMYCKSKNSKQGNVFWTLRAGSIGIETSSSASII